MRRIASFLVAAALLSLVSGDGIARPTPNPTLSVPTSAAGGSLVTVTGTSPSGESGTKVNVSDDYGRLRLHSIEWDGSEFTVKFYAPEFNEEDPENEIAVHVRPQAPSQSVSEYINIRPA